MLKNGRQLSSYFVVAGCTIFVMSREKAKGNVKNSNMWHSCKTHVAFM